ncbi:MAG: hypothetical protein AAGJ52_03095 [Pseudomonadota bacterium]
MEQLIGKSGTGINKSGTGIERSGTGIGKSGTGIGKSGTGAPRAMRRAMGRLAIFTLLALSSTVAMAAGPQVLLTESGESVRLSMHVDQTIVAGEFAVSGTPSGLISIPLHDVLASNAKRGIQQYGSGTGSDSGPCNGTGLQQYGSGTGSLKPCGDSITQWGTAELVFDAGSTFILIHRNGQNGPEEVLATVQTRTNLTGQDSPAAASLVAQTDWMTQH